MSKNLLLSGFVVVFLCLFMASSVFAFDVGGYLYATETSANVQNSTITSGGSQYTLYTISGKAAMLVKGENIVQSQDEIASVFKSKCSASGYPTAAELEDIKTLATTYNASRNSDLGYGPNEYRCIVTTGQNIVDCVDIDSCQAACSSAGITQGSCGRLLAGYGYGMVYSLLDYANARRGMDGNLTTISNFVSELKVGNVDQVTFDIYDKVDKLYTATANLKAAGENLTANKIFVHWSYGGYYLCTTPVLDNASIASAVTKSGALRVKASCFSTITADAKQILNNTLDRVDYHFNVRQKAASQTDFTTLMNEYNDLTANATQIVIFFNVSEINQSMNKIEGYSQAYYTYASASNYDAASEQIINIRSELEVLKSKIADANAAYAVIGAAREPALASVEKLNILIEPTDITLSSEKDAVLSNFNKLEANLSAKVQYSSASALAQQYTAIVDQAKVIINKKKDLEAAKVSNVFSDFSRGISLTVLNAVSDPLGVREEEKRTWMSVLPMMSISIIDIVVLAIIFILFFFIVWNRTKDFLRSKILKTWIIIFAFIILVILGLSYAFISLMETAIGPTSYFGFASHLATSDSVYIFIEYSSSASTAAIGGCASQVEAALNASNKTVTVVNVVDGVCKDQVYSACLTQVGDVPMIKLRYAKTNSTVFYTFYRIESDVSGDAAYFNKCTIATLLK